MSTEFFLANLWRWKCGVPEVDPPKIVPPTAPPYEAMKWSEWSATFERFQRNRLLMGGLRYGLMHANGKRLFDCGAAVEAYIEEYRRTGNLECLVDAGNCCMLEFEHSRHPLRHWAAGDDTGHKF